MKRLAELYQTEDWKKEKHVPVIDCSDAVKKEEKFQITVTVTVKLSQPGAIYATSLCNIHGLWENSKEIGMTYPCKAMAPMR